MFVGYSTCLEQGWELRKHVKSQCRLHPADPFPEIASSTPSPTICDRLLDQYVSTLEPIHRVLRTPSSRKQYERCWTQQQAASAGFLMRLLVILSCKSTLPCF